MISVCIATYNGERFIKQQLTSILDQLGSDDEIVISDDRSTDGTLSVIAGLNDRRIKIFHHEPYNKHSFPLDRSTHNFENALIHAQGDVIFLSDQDDVWLPGKVEKTMMALKDYDFVISDCMITDEQLKVTSPSYFNYKHTNLSTLSNIIFCSWLGCCMAFRRKVIDVALPFPETQVAHDLWLGLIATSKFKCKLLHEPLIYYRRHEHTASPVRKANKYGLWFKLKYRLVTIISLLSRINEFSTKR